MLQFNALCGNIKLTGRIEFSANHIKKFRLSYDMHISLYLECKILFCKNHTMKVMQ